MKINPLCQSKMQKKKNHQLKEKRRGEKRCIKEKKFHAGSTRDNTERIKEINKLPRNPALKIGNH